MKIQVDLKELLKLDLSPSEYCALIIIDKKALMDYPIGNTIFTSLKEKGWIDDSKNILKVYKNTYNIDEWVNLWPTKVLPGGYRVSGNTYDCDERMKKFIRKYGYSWEIIMKATKNYLRRQESKGWSMTKKNNKFIYDQDGSVLADECEFIIKGGIDEEQNTNTLHI